MPTNLFYCSVFVLLFFLGFAVSVPNTKREKAPCNDLDNSNYFNQAGSHPPKDKST